MKDKYRTEVIDPGDQASKMAKEICFDSHGNCPAVEIIPRQPGNFRGAVDFNWNNHILQGMIDGTYSQGVENDGAGGKPQFFTLIGTQEVFSGLGWEIITMTADDFARSGRFPAIMANDLNVKRITENNFHLVQALFEGYGLALKKAGLVNITGEVAVMKHSVTAFCETDPESQLILTWGATCLGLSHNDRVITGACIKPGMAIIGFWEPGYRCNGGTFFTNVIQAKFGPEPERILQNEKALKFVKELTVPSRSYARTICRLVGWQDDGSLSDPLANIAGIAHITGGGVWGKFGEILPDGVGADLHSMPCPATVLWDAQDLAMDTEFELSDWRAYSTLHGGCGMLLVIPEDDVKSVLYETGQDGITAYLVGHTTEAVNGEITIKSRFKGIRSHQVLSSLQPE